MNLENQTNIDVSIIIVNYNTLKMTDECISSIVTNTEGVEYEIILVDNASTDGSKEFFEKDQRVKYIYNSNNSGFGSANNIGINVSSGKYLFLLNSDTILLNNAVKKLFEYAESQNIPACYGCYLVDKLGNINSPAFYFPRFTVGEYIRDTFHHVQYRYSTSEVMNVQCVCGADMFFDKSIIDRVGLFDENIFMYGEDSELQYRMAKDGIIRQIIPGPQIVHFGGGSQNRDSVGKVRFSRINRFKSHFYILKKHMFRPTYYLARIYYALLIVPQNLIKALLVNKEYIIPVKHVLVSV